MIYVQFLGGSNCYLKRLHNINIEFGLVGCAGVDFLNFRLKLGCDNSPGYKIIRFVFVYCVPVWLYGIIYCRVRFLS